ncbi:MAG: hypothetical protein GY803_05360, partial [Chloroflexi bacterium]|nr:hypothetical protein [Chloroflexota bacterium]
WKSADWRSTLSCAIIWLVVFLAAIFVAYPALWGAPGAAFSLLSGNASRHIGSALRPSFFLGEVAYDHGPLFYPVVLAFRLSPVVLVGLVLAVFMALRRDGHFGLRPSVAAQRWRFCQWSCPAVWLLLLWVALFIGGISFAAKKFDRYALAVIPALTILAALAWTQLSDRLPRWGRYAGPGLVVVQAAYLSVFLPYPLAAYNPLLGGPAVAQKALPIGWGEAIGAAAHWLAEQPGMAGKTAVAGIAPSFAPFFPGQTLLSYPENQAQADYIILTANGRQTSPDGTILSDDFTLLHTVLYGGLEQAWIYVQPNPQKPDLTLTDLSNPVAFDNRVRLLATQAVVSGERLDFYARWQLLAGGEDGRYTLKLTLRDSEGRAWAKREIELVNETYFYPQHWSPDEMPQIRYALDLPPGLPPAQYELELALFDSDGAQMPVLAGDGAFQGVVYPAADIVTSSLIGGDLDIPVTAEPGASVAVWLDGGLTLLGHSVVPEAIINGGTAVIDLYWQANAALPGG